MSGSAFPPGGPTSLTQALPAYVYQQFSDDQDIQAFCSAYNNMSQAFTNWFNSINLPIYTGAPIAGPLLDYVATGLYGLARPTFTVGRIRYIGPFNTYTPGADLPLDGLATMGSGTSYVTDDDFYKRVLTWHFYKGDGKQFSVPWLKRRIMRFLLGVNGAAPQISSTYPVSVRFTPQAGTLQRLCTITLTQALLPANACQEFHDGLLSGVLEMPFQYAYAVVLA